MTDAFVTRLAYWLTPFFRSRDKSEFSTAGVVTAVVLLFVLIFSNQAPQNSQNLHLALMKEMLLLPSLMYLTNWAEAHYGALPHWVKWTPFTILAFVIVVHGFTLTWLQ